MAPRRPRKNDEAVESLIRNPSSKTDFRSVGNQQVRINLMFLGREQFVPTLGTNLFPLWEQPVYIGETSCFPYLNC